MGDNGLNLRQKQERLGEIRENTLGCKMKIIKYNARSDIVVEFQDEYKAKINTTYGNFEKGNVKNPYDKEVLGVGYYGQGKYKSRGKDGKQTRAYTTWKSMLIRCYDPYYLDKHPSYRDCMVCEEWHNFQNFARWFEKNYYEIENEKMCLDKDILYKNNKMYSPETCVFVPQRINKLFTKRQNHRGKYLIGISCHKRDNVLNVSCNIYENGKKKTIHLGSFPLNRPFQAFYCYKIFKENYIKQVADEYKDLIPEKLYEAMYNYQVEIND